MLIVGSDSSLSKFLIASARKEKFNVYGTVRSLSREANALPKNNLFRLDLESLDSIHDLMATLSSLQFDRIYILIGKLSKKSPNDMHYDSISQYLSTYGTNLCFLVEELLKNLSTQRQSFLLFVSSRAALNPSYDILYSTAKSCVTSFIRSRSLFLPDNQVANSITSGLIIGSGMYQEMAEQIKKHQKLSDGQLLTIKQFCKELWDLNFETIKDKLGHNIHIGPVY